MFQLCSLQHFGHCCRWPVSLNRAAMRRLPVVQPREDSNGSFSNWRQTCAVLMFISDPLGIGK